MHIIIILLVIIILIMVAPAVLAFLGMLLVSIVSAIIDMWWLFLILFAVPFVGSFIEKRVSSRNRIKHGSRKKRKLLIFSCSIVFIITILIGGLHHIGIISKFPIIADNYADDYATTRRLQQKLLHKGNRHVVKGLSLIDGIELGMQKDEIIQKIGITGNDINYHNKISSKMELNGVYYPVEITLFFDNTNTLEKIILFSDKTDFAYAAKIHFGERYLLLGSDNRNINRLYWLYNDIAIEMTENQETEQYYLGINDVSDSSFISFYDSWR